VARKNFQELVLGFTAVSVPKPIERNPNEFAALGFCCPGFWNILFSVLEKNLCFNVIALGEVRPLLWTK
jgi:hypothetical protein